MSENKKPIVFGPTAYKLLQEFADKLEKEINSQGGIFLKKPFVDNTYVELNKIIMGFIKRAEMSGNLIDKFGANLISDIKRLSGDVPDIDGNNEIYIDTFDVDCIDHEVVCWFSVWDGEKNTQYNFGHDYEKSRGWLSVKGDGLGGTKVIAHWGNVEAIAEDEEGDVDRAIFTQRVNKDIRKHRQEYQKQIAEDFPEDDGSHDE
jgi:hypothetical protein